MAFAYIDPATGKAVFDVATSNIVYQSANGLTKVPLVTDGAFVGYTDLLARNAIKTKTQVNALTPSVTGDPTDLPTALTQIIALKTLVNSIITALKA